MAQGKLRDVARKSGSQIINMTNFPEIVLKSVLNI